MSSAIPFTKDVARDLSTLTMESVMTPTPVMVDEDTDLATARRLLRDKRVRHLPVLHKGELTGILSERDTRLVALMPGLKDIAVADVMSKHPMTVREDVPVLEAMRKMAEKKYGCLVITSPLSGKVSGIFTIQDALQMLLGEKQIHVTVEDFGESSEEWPGDRDDCLE